MKGKISIIFVLLPGILFSQAAFNKYFSKGTLRFDFLLGGNHTEEMVYPVQIKAEPYWGGSETNLIDDMNYGTYRYKITDFTTDSLLFSRGLCTLFQEWQSTAEAKIIDRTFYQAAFFPFPKKKVMLAIDARQRDGLFKTIFRTEIDPDDYFIISEKSRSFPVEKIVENGPPDKKVDLVILAEGYTSYEMDKFTDDAKRLTAYLFEVSPFKEEKNRFNVYAIASPSLESGTDIPGEHIFRNTLFNSTFYTFDEARYLTTSDMKTIYDAASVVPWDQIYILVNSKQYGGGGIYNLVSVCTADHELSEKVFVHEFGHGFAGLGDEYYTSSVAYEDFYNLEIEPWEPNLTTLVNFKNKWENLIPDSVPVPTPRTGRYKNSVGVFEGGGYMNKGMYSPMMDCRMKSNDAKEFCPACQQAIKKMIVFYTR
jgi:hypothetical protein